MRANKKIKRRGYYCKLYQMNCEDAYILIPTFRECEDWTRCNCPECQHSEDKTLKYADESALAPAAE